MKDLQQIVNLERRSYSVWVHEGIPGAACPLISERFPKGPVTLVTDENVARLYLSDFVEALSSFGFQVHSHIVPAGESSKSFQTAEGILTEMVQRAPDRTRPVIALGGGVIGDLAGFVASLYQRGVPVVHIATTLLSMVDSSVGGKTAVNHHGTKNMVGTFHQPSLVFCPMKTLETLEEREFRSGLSEMLKAGFLRDPELVASMESGHTVLHSRRGPLLQECIWKAIGIKARIVEQDERESGQRALLNLGHTLGHALESAFGLGKWTHGEAVAIGMTAAARISAAQGWCTPAVSRAVENALERLSLPRECAEPEGWREALARDKKTRGSDLSFVGLQAIGKPCIERIKIEDVIFWIETLMFGYPRKE